MNKPAAKEPSMDEILSSIRQIIADDDASAGSAPAAPVDDSDDGISFDLPDDLTTGLDDDAASDEPEALELSEEQIVGDDDVDGLDFDIPDIDAATAEDMASDDDEGEFTMPEMVMPDDIDLGTPEPEPEPEPFAAASMPDPDLSADIADSLLEPATDAAVKNAFARIGSATMGADGQLTIENMIREMLRPMLKSWLDENLPTMVEKIVEKEIERLSGGK